MTEAYLDEPWPIADSFYDPVEAEEHVDKLLKRTARLDVFSAGDSPVRRKRLTEIYTQLTLAIDNSLNLFLDCTMFQHDMRLLKLHLRVVHILLKTNMVSNEVIFDRYEDDFASLLDDAEDLLTYELQPDSDRGPTCVRSTLGLLPPMFLVATKCRNSAIRKRALRLIHKSRRRERTWNSCIAYTLAYATIQLEERTANETAEKGLVIEEKIRVCLHSVCFDQANGRITIEYMRMPWTQSSISHTVERPWEPRLDNNYDCVSLSRKSLRAYGYTGTILVSPRIECQCGRTKADSG